MSRYITRHSIQAKKSAIPSIKKANKPYDKLVSASELKQVQGEMKGLNEKRYGPRNAIEELRETIENARGKKYHRSLPISELKELFKNLSNGFGRSV